MSLGRIAGPIWAGLVFDVNYDLPYISGSAILFVGFLVSLVLVRDVHREMADADTQSASDR
jgi:DHA1 family multidrug resistance protein-like MFS transporter